MSTNQRGQRQQRGDAGGDHHGVGRHRLALTFDQLVAGTARSRLKANSIREALVWQAVVQNS